MKTQQKEEEELILSAMVSVFPSSLYVCWGLASQEAAGHLAFNKNSELTTYLLYVWLTLISLCLQICFTYSTVYLSPHFFSLSSFWLSFQSHCQGMSELLFGDVAAGWSHPTTTWKNTLWIYTSIHISCLLCLPHFLRFRSPNSPFYSWDT